MNLLVVDDIEENRQYLKSLFESQGHVVTLARNGAEALLALPGPDVVVSDILMPVMDGYELCRRVRADPRLSAIPFAFYTATYTREEDRLFGLSLGADLFLVKPMEPDPLLRAIERLAGSDGRLRARDESPREERRTKASLDELSWLRGHERALSDKLQKKVLDLEEANARLREAEVEARKASERNEHLYRELLHRTRNNLQVVLSLLRLYASEAGSTAESLAERMDLRVQTLMLAQEKMYESGDYLGLELSTFMPELAAVLYTSLSREGLQVELRASSRPAFVPADQLASFAFVVEELVANALRHAFPGRARGTVTVTSGLDDQGCLVATVCDDGVGIAEGALRGSGLRIAEDIARTQLSGSLEIRPASPGTCCTLRFPLRPRK